ncbi:hypothetical protein LQL77_30130 [Rhodococcus cerastii]|nr:hypothetical protein [Rhodococcus cerastii]
MDSFHVVHLAAEKLTLRRQRMQLVARGHPGRNSDPWSDITRALPDHTTLRTDQQEARLPTSGTST